MQCEARHVLKHIEHEEDRKVGVAVNIEGIEPLDLLLNLMALRLRPQVRVGEVPARGGQADAKQDEVYRHRPNNGLDRLPHRRTEAERGEGRKRLQASGRGGKQKKDTRE